MEASYVTEFLPLANDSTPVLLGASNCIPSNYDLGAMHILRCLEFEDSYTDAPCTHDNDIIIQCYDQPLNAEGYDTQLFLNSDALKSTYRSSGVLEIYSSISQSGAFAGWRNICGNKFDQNAANSACRQLGYTGALSYSTHANHSRDKDIWLDGATCGDNAYSCLDHCFCYPQPRSFTAVQCDPHKVVALTCTYDLDDEDENDPGSRTPM